MKRELTNQLENNIMRYEEKLLHAVERYAYEKARYDIDYTIAIAITAESLELEGFSQTIRMTDAFISLDENLYGVIFASANADLGIKAASNLLHKFEMQFFATKIYLGIISSEDELNVTKMIRKLFVTLNCCLDDGKSNIPVDYGDVSNKRYAV